MPLSPGQLLNNRYEIRAILGQGGMGAVYDGWDKNLGIRVAIKENLLFTEASQRQFEREAHMLASLRHSNLPGVIDHFHIAGQGQYLVMSFIEGEDLAQRLKRLGPLPEAAVLRWTDDVLNALAYLHRRGIIHRDIKPNNIKVTPDGEAVLVDFGIAKEIIDETGATTTTGARGLTPGFAPPEQYGGTRTDARSDIYAFGATLYTLLTGQAPADALLRMGRHDKHIPLARQLIKVNNILARAVDKALALNADNRWPSAEAMKNGLRSLEKVTPIKSPPSGDERPTVPSGGTPKPGPQFPRINVPTQIFGIVGIAILAIAAVYATNWQAANPAATNTVTVEPTTTSKTVTTTVKASNIARSTATLELSDTQAPPTSTKTSMPLTSTRTATNVPTTAPTRTRQPTLSPTFAPPASPSVTPPVPNSPSNIAVSIASTANGEATLLITWNDNSDNEGAYFTRVDYPGGSRGFVSGPNATFTYITVSCNQVVDVSVWSSYAASWDAPRSEPARFSGFSIPSC